MYTINREHTYSQPPKRIIRTWKDHINSLPNYEKSLLKNTNIIANNIDADINETDLIMSSDESYKTTKSGGAFIIAKKNGEILVTGSNSDTGHPDYQQAYRSEAQAKLAGHICLKEICTFHNLPHPMTISSCDNKGLKTKLAQNGTIKKKTKIAT